MPDAQRPSAAQPSVQEADLYDPIRLALSTHRLGVVFRNHVGTSTHRTSTHAAGMTVRHGLPKGSSDLIGWTLPGPLHPGGLFLAIEVKRPLWRPQPAWIRDRQAAFLRAIVLAGGVGFVARGPDEAVAILRGEVTPVYPI
jgi:hypothetical protein